MFNRCRPYTCSILIRRYEIFFSNISSREDLIELIVETRVYLYWSKKTYIFKLVIHIYINDTIWFAGAPRGIFGDQDVNITSGELTVRMTAYPTPMVKKITFLGHNKSLDGEPVKENTFNVQCSASFLAPAEVTCNIKMMIIANNNEGFYRIIFSNSLGDLPFTFFVKGNCIYLWDTRKKVTHTHTLPLPHM